MTSAKVFKTLSLSTNIINMFKVEITTIVNGKKIKHENCINKKDIVFQVCIISLDTNKTIDTSTYTYKTVFDILAIKRKNLRLYATLNGLNPKVMDRIIDELYTICIKEKAFDNTDIVKISELNDHG